MFGRNICFLNISVVIILLFSTIVTKSLHTSRVRPHTLKTFVVSVNLKNEDFFVNTYKEIFCPLVCCLVQRIRNTLACHAPCKKATFQSQKIVFLEIVAFCVVADVVLLMFLAGTRF